MQEKKSHFPEGPINFTILDKILDFNSTRVSYLTKVTPIDRFFSKTVLKLIPRFVTPNYITIFRFLTIPLIIYLLVNKDYTWAMILFAFGAFSDAVDGALARTTKQVTDWGTIYDPLTDKLLVGSVTAIVVTQYLGLTLALSIIIIELLLIISAYQRFKGKVVPAKTVGKIKMILQCVGLAVLLLFLVFPWIPILITAKYILYGAVAFGFLSLFVYRSV